MQSGAVTYLLALTVTFMYHSVAGELIVTPRNTETKVGETTYLNCSTNETEEIFWYHGEAYIYHAYNMFEPYIGRFEIDRNASNGSHNLVIYSVQSSDAGKYICIDKDGLGGRQSAELVVLENDPDCHSDMQPDGIIGQNVFGIPPDEAQLTCNVSYHGNIPPLMVWKKVGGYSSVKDAVTSNTTSNNRYIYALKIKGDFTLNNSSYVCETTRSKQKQYKCASETIKVLYFVGGNMVEQKVFKGDEITCVANRNTFSCINQWHYGNYTLDETIKTQLLGEYLCTVKCHIRGTAYTFDAIKAFVVELKTSEDTLPTASGTIAAVAVVAIVVIVILAASTVAVVEQYRKSKGVYEETSRYPMDKRPRGLCLIVNIDNYVHLQPRTGGRKDAELLSKLFKDLHFEVKLYTDVTADTLMLIFSTTNKTDHTNYDAFVCCINSHGKQGVIYTSDDKPLKIISFVDFFTDEHCPTLKGKPKMFFIQACQSAGPAIEEDGASVTSALMFDENLPTTTSPLSPGLVPGSPGFLMSYSTLPGSLSFRDAHGSFYIQSLCDCLRKGMEIDRALQMVSFNVAERLKQLGAPSGGQRPFHVKSGMDKLIYL